MTSSLSTAFVLKSVEVKNWKTFTDATLNVSETGLTGIVGQNGSGKSSFVDAILWCLYAYKPAEISQTAFRRRNSDPKKDDTSVKVTFTHAGQTIEVFRRMKGKNSTVTADIFMDGVEQTHATGTTAQTWVTNRLGMDAQGFRTAVVVPQKELDALVDAKPAPRREHIEKLAGIEDMNLAVKKAREEENELAKQIKLLPGSVEAVEEAGEFLESLIAEHEGVVTLCEDATHEVEKLETDVNQAIDNSADSKEKLKVAFDLHRDITDLEHKVDMAKAAIKQFDSQIDSLNDEVSGIDITARPKLENEYREVNDEYSKINHELANHTGNISNVQREIASLESALKTKQDKLVVLTNRFKEGNEFLSTLDEDEALAVSKKKLEEEISEANARMSSLKSLIADLEDSVRVLSSHDHSEAKCPTCHSTLEDPERLLAQFRKTVDSSKEEITELRKKNTKNSEAINSVNSSIVSKERAEREIASIEQEISALKSEIETLESTLSDTRKKLTEIEGFDVEAAKAKISELDLTKRDILSSGEKIAAAEKSIAKRDALISQREAKANDLKPSQDKLSALEEKLDGYGDLSHLEMLVSGYEAEIERIRSEYNSSFRKMKDLESRKAMLNERVKSAQSNFDREEKLAKSKTVALKKLEEKSAVSDLLDEYRKDRIARIAPELSGTATDLISQMTNGRFIEVIVYDDFATAVVKDDGFEYSVYELSGGEKSIVALALRIAIGSLITGENAGLLWLDEVLPAQDVERRDAILSVLRSLPIQQIVMINHTHEAEDVVDQVVKINYDGTGSTID
jgi:exonuclease SbcC